MFATYQKKSEVDSACAEFNRIRSWEAGNIVKNIKISYRKKNINIVSYHKKF